MIARSPSASSNGSGVPSAADPVDLLAHLAPEERAKAEALAASHSWYRPWPTADLLAEAEALGYELAELAERQEAGDPDPSVAAGIDVLAWKAGEAARELKRRDRLRAQPGAPGRPAWWPDARAEAERLAGTVDVARFASGYLGVDLKPTGGGRSVGRCPLPGHRDDDSPSFTVYPGDRGWFCFGCHQGGTLWTLVFRTHPEATGYADAVALVRSWGGAR